MTNLQKIIFLILILISFNLVVRSEGFACSDYNNAKVINYNACDNDPEGCRVMVDLNGKAFCTNRMID